MAQRTKRLVKGKRASDRALFLLAVSVPLLSVPQLVKIVTEKNTAGISIFTWVLYTLFAFIWLAYGLRTKERLITISYVGNVVVYTLILFGLMWYH